MPAHNHSTIKRWRQAKVGVQRNRQKLEVLMALLATHELMGSQDEDYRQSLVKKIETQRILLRHRNAD